MLQLQHHIYFIRGQKVMLDADLAAIYGVTTKQLNQAVKRNEARFPDDFRFQLSKEEWQDLREYLSEDAAKTDLKSQTVTSSEDTEEQATEVELAKVKWGGRRYPPHAFTEHGAVMLASVLRSERAVQASIQVVRAFVRMRTMLLNQEEFARRLAHLEEAVESNFNIAFDAINELMAEREQPRRMIGFKREEE